jgi:hypothetical protein
MTVVDSYAKDRQWPYLTASGCPQVRELGTGVTEADLTQRVEAVFQLEQQIALVILRATFQHFPKPRATHTSYVVSWSQPPNILL